jgi:hypothetical protein
MIFLVVTILGVVAVVVVSFLAGRCVAPIEDIFCRCHRTMAREVLILDPIDRTRVAALLSQGCPYCSTRPRDERSASVSAGPLADVRGTEDVAPPLEILA